MMVLGVLFILIASLLMGCGGTSIRHLGTVPKTAIDCYSIKDRDFFVAGILLVCTQEGQIRAAAGGAAPGAASLVGSAVQGVGVLGAGIAVGGGIRSLTDIHGIIDEKVTGTVHLAPPR